MQPKITLLLAFEGEEDLASSVKRLVEGASEEFHLLSRVLPHVDESDYAVVLPRILIQSSPALIVFCVPRDRCHPAESAIRVIRSASDTPLVTVSESTELENIS